MELGNALEEAPIIPARLYIKLKPMIEQKILYSNFERSEIREEEEYPRALSARMHIPGRV